MISVSVPPNAEVGETYARFRLSQDGNLGPNGDASSGEVEDLRLVIGHNPFQNPIMRHDVNDSGSITPRDIAENGISSIARCGEYLVAVSYDGVAYLVQPDDLSVKNCLRGMVQRLQPSGLIRPAGVLDTVSTSS